ncbi:MAG: hypothetical protein FJ146_06715 [Deltaproteobacteria bacterium]|nr:hypothetical protein [Deltaproteobacteria bacterium]
MWQILCRIIFILLAVSAQSLTALAEDSKIWASHHLDLGQRFYEARDFSRSSEEFERALILIGPAAPLNLQLKLADSYYLQGKFNEAQAVISGRLSSVIASPCFGDTKTTVTDPAECIDAKVLLAKSLIQMDAYHSAESTLSDTLTPGTTNHLSANQATSLAERLSRSRLLLGTALAAQSRLEEAMVQYQAVVTSKSSAPTYKELARRSEELIRTFEAEKPYSSRVASLLAAIPGLGHAYSGEYAVAASSLIVNSALFYLTYDSWKKSQKIPGYSPATAIGWGTLAATFYTANIYSAGEIANRRNDDRRTRLRRGLQDLSLGEDSKF